MSGTFYTMQAVNLFCNDLDPNEHKALTIAELKLPDLTEKYQDHHAGGALVAIEVPLGVDKLEATFKLNGIDPNLLVAFGLGSQVRRTFTAYGVVMDQKTGQSIEAMAIFQARLGKIAPDAFQRGNLMGHEYSISSIVHYEFWFNKAPKIEWDHFTALWRIDGVDQNADANAILRIS